LAYILLLFLFLLCPRFQHVFTFGNLNDLLSRLLSPIAQFVVGFKTNNNERILFSKAMTAEFF